MASHIVQPRIDHAAQEEVGGFLASMGPTVSGALRLLRKARRFPREHPMRRHLSSLAVVPILALTGCNDPVRPSPWDDVSGTFRGAMNAITNPDFRFRGTITLDMTQADSILSGTYQYDATFTLDGEDLSFVNGGTIAGAIAQGANPVIDLELTDGKDCLFADTMTLTGHHLTGARLMNLRGRIEFDNEDCVWYAGFFHQMSLASLEESFRVP